MSPLQCCCCTVLLTQLSGMYYVIIFLLSWLFVQRTLYRGQSWVLAAVEGWVGKPGPGDWRGQARHGALHCQLPLSWGLLPLLQQYGGAKYCRDILKSWNVFLRFLLLTATSKKTRFFSEIFSTILSMSSIPIRLLITWLLLTWTAVASDDIIINRHIQ